MRILDRMTLDEARRDSAILRQCADSLRGFWSKLVPKNAESYRARATYIEQRASEIEAGSVPPWIPWEV